MHENGCGAILGGIPWAKNLTANRARSHSCAREEAILRSKIHWSFIHTQSRMFTVKFANANRQTNNTIVSF